MSKKGGGGALRLAVYNVGPNADAADSTTDTSGTLTQTFISYFANNVLPYDQQRVAARGNI